MAENKVKFCGRFCPYDKKKIICPLGYENVETKETNKDITTHIDPTKIPIKSVKPEVYKMVRNANGVLVRTFATFSGTITSAQGSVVIVGQMTDLTTGDFSASQVYEIAGENAEKISFSGRGTISIIKSESDFSGIIQYTLSLSENGQTVGEANSYYGNFDLNYKSGSYKGVAIINNVTSSMTLNFGA